MADGGRRLRAPLDRLLLAIEFAAARAEDGLDPTLLRRLRGLAAAHKRGGSGAAYSRRMWRPPPMLVLVIPQSSRPLTAQPRRDRLLGLRLRDRRARGAGFAPDVRHNSAWDHQPWSPFSLRSRNA
jgi:hypothetical protein